MGVFEVELGTGLVGKFTKLTIKHSHLNLKYMYVLVMTRLVVLYIYIFRKYVDCLFKLYFF